MIEDTLFDNDFYAMFVEQEDREEYELATEQMEHDAMYELTYNSEDGSM